VSVAELTRAISTAPASVRAVLEACFAAADLCTCFFVPAAANAAGALATAASQTRIRRREEVDGDRTMSST
jgi:hypothetical protein